MRSDAPLSDADYELILSLDFFTFVERSFRELHPQSVFQHAPYLELLAAKLDGCRTGRIRRLIINVPPRHTKSILASVALPAWLLGHDPGLGIICASYGGELAETFARQSRRLMETGWYRTLFPTRLSRNAVNDFATTKGGHRLATSVGGVLTGRGADVIIIDDPVKPDEAFSDVRRRGVNEWFDNSLLSRLNNPETGAIIIVMQRLHTDDLVGPAVEKGGWEVLALPAIAEVEERIRYDTFLGPRTFHRRTGEALHPARLSVEKAEELRREVGPYNFAGQFQQNPVPSQGILIRRAWLCFYGSHEASGPLTRVIQSWDTASKAGELNDYSVCTTWGERQGRYYLLDVFRKRLEFPDLKRAAFRLAHERRPNAILVEDRSSGTQLVQELRRETGLSVIARQPLAGDKIMRLHAHTAAFESGRVVLPEAAPWLDDYVLELTGFPAARHDDQVDSTTQALTYLTEAPPPLIITEEMLRMSRMPVLGRRRRY